MYYYIYFKIYFIIQFFLIVIVLVSLWKVDKLEYLGFIKILQYVVRIGIIDGDNFLFLGIVI